MRALVTAETNADGTFEATFTVPAVTFATYNVTAIDEYSIEANDAFKVGLIAMLINPTYGEAGTKIAITGIGFEDGSYNLTFAPRGAYNATFGTELYADHGTVVGEAIDDTFYAPNVVPGYYTLTIIDTAENELSVQFIVIESTTASIDPAVAPNDYNVSISGNNFADIENGALTFEMYNSTDEWTMSVYTDPGAIASVTDSDGNFIGFWIVPADTVLSIGDYTINITDSQDLMVQLSFSVVAARVDVAPRRASFDRGTIISFDIFTDFELPDSYIEIYSPDYALYWITDAFTGVWVLVYDLYTVPYYRQTANSNLMELQRDAPLGTWTYFFYDSTDDELLNGTFDVYAPDLNTHEIQLILGWNLIGLTFTPEDPSTAVVLSDIIDYVEVVWAFDRYTKTWSSYSLGAPSDLTEMVEDRGYWIKVNTDCVLTIYR